ncbi:MAG: PAS domain S-box protein [Anaerolineaceae bacterium]|nr:PAS domain S-box protein [Anaerolineaceae bacterium]
MQKLQLSHPLVIFLIQSHLLGPDLLSQKLRQCGYQAELSLIASEAGLVEQARSGHPDLIISDLGAPGAPALNAEGVLVTLQANQLDIPLIIIAGENQEETAAACLERGATDYLLGGELLRLGHCIGQILETRRIKNELEQANLLIETLSHTVERYQCQFENASDILTLSDAETGQLLDANPRAEEVYGYAHEELLGMTMNQLQAQTDTPDGLQTRTAKGLFETLHRKKDGSLIPVEISSRKAVQAGKKVVISTIRGISERIKMEEGLRRSNQELEQFFSMTPDLLSIATSDGRFIRANPAWEKILGYSEQELTAKDFMDLVHPDDASFTRKAVQQLASQGSPVHFAIRCRSKGGTYHWLDWNIIQMGELYFVAGRDISERKQVEQALETSRHTLQLFVENAPAAIAMFDLDMRYLAASRRYMLDYRLEAQDLTGHSHYEIFPEIPERWKEIHRRCLAGATEKCEEDSFPRQDGSLEWVRWEIRPWYSASGDIGGIVLFSEVTTEHKQTLEKLRQSESQLAESQKLAKLGSYQFDYPAGKVFWSQELYRIFERDESQKEPSSQEFLTYVNPDDRERIIQSDRVSATKGLPFDFEYRICTNTGEEKYLRTVGGPVRDEMGKTTHIVGTIQDITASKLANQALDESEKKYRTLVEASIDAIIMTDEGGRIVEWNHGAEKIYGLNKDQVLGQPLWDVQFQVLLEERRTPENYERHKQAVLAILQNGISPWHDQLFKTSFQRMDGSLGVMSNISYTVKTNNGYLLCGISRDITEQERIEESVRLSEQKYRSLFENMHEGVVYYDDQTNITDVNQAAAEMIGLSMEQIKALAQLKNERPIYLEDGSPLPDEEYPAAIALRTGQEVHNVAAKVFNPLKGRYCWVQASAVPLFRPGESVPYQVFSTVEDITAMRETQENLQAAHQELEAIIQSSPLAIAVLDTQALVRLWNPAAERLFGWSAAEAMGKELPFFLPERLEAVHQMIQEEVQQGVTRSGVEAPRICKDGSVIEVRFSSAVLRDSQGQINGSIGLYENITQRKQGERKLSQSHDRYRQLFENSGTAVLIVDEIGQYVLANKLAAANLGKKPAELIGRSMFDFIPADQAERYLEQNRQLIQSGGHREYEDTFQLPTGEKTFLIIDQVIQDENGRNYAVQSSSIDITERKRMEVEIRRSEAMLRQAQSLAKLGFWEWDVRTGKTIWSDEMFPIYGISSTEFTGNGKDYLNFTHPDDRYIQRENIRRGYDGVDELVDKSGVRIDTRADPKEFRIIRKDGSICYVRGDTVNVVDADGSPLHMYGILLDISEQQQAEKAVRESHALLDSIINSTSDLIWSVDAEKFGMVVFNQGLKDYFRENRDVQIETGYRPEEILPTKEYVALWRGFYQQALREGTFTTECQAFNRDKTLLLTFNPLKQGDIVYGISVFGKDITAQKLAENKIRQSEEGLRKAQQVSHVGSWSWYIPANQLEWSDEFYRIFGIEKELFTGFLPEVIERAIHPDDREKVNQSNLSVSQDKKLVPLEFRIIWPDQSVHWVWAEAGDLLLDKEEQPAYLTGFVQDITERKQAEEVLRETSHWLSEAERIGQVGGWSLKISTGLAWGSPEAKKIYGLDEEYLTIAKIQGIVLPEYRSLMDQALEGLIKGSRRYDIEFRIRHSKTGELRDIHSVAEYHPETQQVFGVIQDITEQKQAERALRESESRYRLITDNMADVVWIFDPKSRQLKFTSPSVQRLRGFTPIEAIAQPLEELMTPKSLAMFKGELIDRVREFQEGNSEAVYRTYEIEQSCKDGSTIWVEISTTMIRTESGALEIIGVSHNINARKQAEQALRESEERERARSTELQAIMDAVPALVWVAHDPACSQVEGNKTAYDFLKLRPGKNLSVFNQSGANSFGYRFCKNGQEIPWVEMPLTTAIATGLPKRDYEYDLVFNSGDTYNLFGNTVPLIDAQGQISGAVGVFIDITARKQAEQALGESEERFRTLIEQAPVAISMSRNGRTVYGNPNYLSMFGFQELKSIEGHLLGEQIAPQSRQEIISRALKREYGQPAEMEYDTIGQRQDGSQFPFHVATSRVVLNDGPATIGFFTDITKQKAADEEIRQQAAHANALASLTSSLSVALDPDDLLHMVCAELTTTLDLKCCAVYLYDDQKHTLYPAYNQYIPADLWSRLPIVSVEPNSALDLPVQVFSRSGQERVGHDGLSLTGMIYQGQLVGALALPAGGQAKVYSMEERSLVQAFARQAAIAMINLRLFEETRKHTDEMEKLAEVSSSLRQARTLAEMVPLLIAQTVQVMHGDTGALFFYPEDRFNPKQLEVLPQPGPEWTALWDQIISREIPQNEQAFYSSSSLEDEASDLLTIQRQSKGVDSYAVVMIKSVESLIGFLCVGYQHAHTFQQDEKRLLVSIAEMAGNAIHRTNILDTLEQRVQVRTRELEALYDIARLTSGSLDLQAMLDQSLNKLLEVYHVQSGLIQLMSNNHNELELAAYRGLSEESIRTMKKIPLQGNIAARVIEEDRAYLSLNIPQKLGNNRSSSSQDLPNVYLGAPIRAKGEILGVVSIYYSDALHRFSVEEVALLETMANQIGMVIDSARLREQSQNAAILEERQRLARELHDSVTQSLYSMNLLADGYRKRAAKASPEELDSWFADLGFSAHQALKDMRLLLYELRPGSILHDGLATAIKRRLDSVESRSGIAVQFNFSGDLNLLSKPEEIELYHIAQEALNNSLKHAQASRIEISLFVQGEQVILEIDDNGCGFNPQEPPSEGMGLANMTDRARKLGGELEVYSFSGKGTRIKFSRKVSHE